MTKYKIETHLHTAYISKCGWMGAEAIVYYYKKCGYHGICVTDHYNRTAFRHAEIDLGGEGSKTEAFLAGYRRVKEEAARYGIKVYEGAEVRFDGSPNDYLVYGFPHSLLADPEKVMSEGLEAFSEKCRESGTLLIQAHPFRHGCKPMPARLLDGMEGHNGCVRHDSHNGQAQAYAKEQGLLLTSGSDFHRPGDEGEGGILAEELPENSYELAKLLRSGNFEIYRGSGGDL